MARPLSNHPILYYLGIAAGIIGVGFGTNAFINPINAMTFFEIDRPTSGDGQDFFNLMLPVYGARNIAIGSNILAAAYRKDFKLMGWNIFSFSLCAVVDGIVCWQRGHGQGGHWGYAPQLIILASLLMGVFDGRTPLDREKKTA